LADLDDRHGACQRFRSRVGSRKEPVESSNAYWTQGPLSGIVVDRNATVFEEQAERGPAAQTVSESCRQIAFAWNAG
jgi:hypothetical protein